MENLLLALHNLGQEEGELESEACELQESQDLDDWTAASQLVRLNRAMVSHFLVTESNRSSLKD